MARRRDKNEEKALAARRIDGLLARGREDLARADRLGELALAVARKHQTGLTRTQKTQVCRKCGRMRTAASSRVRIRAGRIVTTCTCSFIHRRRLEVPHA